MNLSLLGFQLFFHCSVLRFVLCESIDCWLFIALLHFLQNSLDLYEAAQPWRKLLIRPAVIFYFIIYLFFCSSAVISVSTKVLSRGGA